MLTQTPIGENRFKQLIKKVGQEKAMEMLEKSEQGFKENYALLKKLNEMCLGEVIAVCHDKLPRERGLWYNTRIKIC